MLCRVCRYCLHIADESEDGVLLENPAKPAEGPTSTRLAHVLRLRGRGASGSRCHSGGEFMSRRPIGLVAAAFAAVLASAGAAQASIIITLTGAPVAVAGGFAYTYGVT